MDAPSQAPLRIAMWSGPRNVSTALLRSFGNRADTAVVDEPLYAHYLQVTQRPHPGSDAVLASQPNDWRDVARDLTGPVPGGAAVWYQKHMAHHLLPEVGRDWLGALTHAFLIRDPREMLPSLDAVFPRPALEDTGFPQQVELFDRLRAATGEAPPVVDSRDVLEDPRGVLGALCERLGIAFDEAMLAWPPGRRATDGAWAPHWYDAVERSTGFAPYRPKTEPLAAHLEPVLAAARPLYDHLHAHRLRA
jgi:hypothetical protein